MDDANSISHLDNWVSATCFVSNPSPLGFLKMKRIKTAIWSLEIQECRGRDVEMVGQWFNNLGVQQPWNCLGMIPKIEHTVDGQIPAPPRMMIIPLFIGFQPSQVVVWDFVHQQYVVCSLKFLSFPRARCCWSLQFTIICSSSGIWHMGIPNQSRCICCCFLAFCMCDNLCMQTCMLTIVQVMALKNKNNNNNNNNNNNICNKQR